MSRLAWTDEELDAAELWCTKRLIEFEQEDAYSVFPCEYDDELPTHSVRSTIASLVAEVRRSRESAPALAPPADKHENATKEAK